MNTWTNYQDFIKFHADEVGMTREEYSAIYLSENTIMPYDQFNLIKENFKTWSNLEIINEGGAAGHMMHPFDDQDLTFGDFKRIATSALQGELNFEEQPTEKTDGQNLFVTVKDGIVLFARNKGQLISPLDLNGVIKMFTGHASKLVEETYIFAATDLSEALGKLKDYSEFKDGTSFMNMELIYSKNPNVIRYDRDVIQFHGITHTDGSGNITGTDSKVGGKLAKILKELKADIQKTFTIIPPQILKMHKDIEFDSKVDYYIKKIDKLRDTYKLSDTDEVKMYHEMWWRNQIENEFSELLSDVKHGLLLRWAYGDKQTLNMVNIKKLVDKDQIKAIKEFDKNRLKKYKENILPFENLFLELGSDVLKNVSNFVAANPEAEKQRLHTQIRTEAGKIKKNGDLTQIAKVERELNRLETIGGIESIIPTEGLVFIYNGKTFKLTGTFAAINQLMGIIKYGN